jgi:hypothetical protein
VTRGCVLARPDPNALNRQEARSGNTIPSVDILAAEDH